MKIETTITLKCLEENEACEEVITAFKKRFGKKALTRDVLKAITLKNYPYDCVDTGLHGYIGIL